MSNLVQQWTQTRSNVNRIGFRPNYDHLLDNADDTADVTFVFPEKNSKQNGTRNKPEKVRAHKFVLTTYSQKFKAMFDGPSKKKKEIQIKDISMSTFQSMIRYVCTHTHTQCVVFNQSFSNNFFFSHFRYVYTGQAIADGEDLVALYYAVNKFDFADIRKSLEEKLIDDLTIDNVLERLEWFKRFGRTEVDNEIKKFVANHLMQILEHQSFVRIHRSTVTSILLLNHMNAVEIQIFDAFAGPKPSVKGMELKIQHPSN